MTTELRHRTVNTVVPRGRYGALEALTETPRAVGTSPDTLLQWREGGSVAIGRVQALVARRRDTDARWAAAVKFGPQVQ